MAFKWKTWIVELQNFGVERDLRENIVEFLYLKYKESWAPDRLRYLVQGHMIKKSRGENHGRQASNHFTGSGREVFEKIERERYGLGSYRVITSLLTYFTHSKSSLLLTQKNSSEHKNIGRWWFWRERFIPRRMGWRVGGSEGEALKV